MTELLKVQDVTVRFGGLAAVQSVSLCAKQGEITAIIGPNGAGKTTLFNTISGVYRLNDGSIWLNGENIKGMALHRLAGRGLARTFQNLRLFDEMSAIENVMVGFHLQRRTSFLQCLLGTPASRRERSEMQGRAAELLGRVGLKSVADVPANSLSYGQMKRLEIARSLATEPRLLLLDEPAAGCNATETEEIKTLILDLKAGGLSILLVEHDMGMVMSLSDYVYVLDGGRNISEGKPQTVVNDPVVIEAYLGTEATLDSGKLAHA